MAWRIESPEVEGLTFYYVSWSDSVQGPLFVLDKDKAAVFLSEEYATKAASRALVRQPGRLIVRNLAA
jgi:hypothetical protein